MFKELAANTSTFIHENKDFIVPVLIVLTLLDVIFFYRRNTNVCETCDYINYDDSCSDSSSEYTEHSDPGEKGDQDYYPTDEEDNLDLD